MYCFITLCYLPLVPSQLAARGSVWLGAGRAYKTYLIYSVCLKCVIFNLTMAMLIAILKPARHGICREQSLANEEFRVSSHLLIRVGQSNCWNVPRHSLAPTQIARIINYTVYIFYLSHNGLLKCTMYTFLFYSFQFLSHVVALFIIFSIFFISTGAIALRRPFCQGGQ